jgi:hypothetical protein
MTMCEFWRRDDGSCEFEFFEFLVVDQWIMPVGFMTFNDVARFVCIEIKR